MCTTPLLPLTSKGGTIENELYDSKMIQDRENGFQIQICWVFLHNKL